MHPVNREIIFVELHIVRRKTVKTNEATVAGPKQWWASGILGVNKSLLLNMHDKILTFGRYRITCVQNRLFHRNKLYEKFRVLRYISCGILA